MPPKHEKIKRGLLQIDWRDQIIGWRDAGDTYDEIIAKCNAQGRRISKSGVHHVLHKDFVPRRYHSASLKDRQKFFDIRDLVITTYLDDSQASLSSIVKIIEEKFEEKNQWYGVFEKIVGSLVTARDMGTV
ncbi:hypothetical protein PRIPAC_85290 [Pristionchus pacificus]|uniref:Uncharacterized protein n=1 Tax=Pristionchus pacificus TaxID=54126 RepID=A0A2A6BKN0_PRIPA|nr:hypothetical protein PRIPAC_85290 [Pristionchus pacificus]|eukprot:PDM66447.1 hypothetical protein PRIPAC_47864 [Pristionchus pacificus]